jgi:pimeloyl-ACP methyl ester carboxylesterase/uncharacterized protein YndB with AHSA1/START domain
MQNENNSTADREIRISRLLNAPVELVWEVWVDANHIKNWWGPDGFTNTITHMDVQPGGAWHLTMHGPDGTDYRNESTFTEVELHKKLVYKHVSAPKFVATIEFESQGDKTFLSWHMLFESKEQFIQVVKTFKADEGLRQNVEKMGRYLERFGQRGYSQVNGISMYYEIHGAGEPLVLIHGGGSTIDTTFGKILPLLSDKYKVVAVELQAHGRTSDRDAPESFEQDADDVAALLGNLNISRASFFGFSNGGSTAMQIAMRHPEITENLILASAFYKREGLIPGMWEGLKDATLKDMPETLVAAFLQVCTDTGKLQAMFDKDKARMLQFKDWEDEALQGIKAPVLIINGDRDVITAAHTAAMSKLIPNSRMMILPAVHGSYMGTAETPFEGEHMLEFIVAVIADFLGGRLK